MLGVAALSLAANVGESTIVPVLPELRDELAISAVASGLLLSMSMLAMLVASVPLGLLGARIGTRRVLLAAAVLAPLGLLAAAAWHAYWPLLVARLATGLASSVLWTLGASVIAASARRTAGTGAVIIAASLGWLVGPAASGLLADVGGTRLPFLVLGLATLPLALVVARAIGPDVEADQPHGLGLGTALEDAVRDRHVRAGVIAMGVLGVATGATGLLAPLALDRNGLSSGAIGLLLAGTTLIWIACAAGLRRVPDRRVSPALVAAPVALLAVAYALPSLASSSATVVAFLLVSGVGRAAVNTLVFVLAANGRRGATNAGPVGGLMMVAWSGAGLGAPLLLGTLADARLGLAFALVAGTMGLAAAGIATSRRAARATAAG